MRAEMQRCQVTDKGLRSGGSPAGSGNTVAASAGRYANASTRPPRARRLSMAPVFDDNTSQWSESLTITGEAGCELGGIIVDDEAMQKHEVPPPLPVLVALVHRAARLDSAADTGSGSIASSNAAMQAGGVGGKHVIVNTASILESDSSR